MTPRSPRSKKKEKTTTKIKIKQTKVRHPDEYSQTLRKEHPTKNPCSAFAAKPVKVAFDSQLNEEKIVLLLRRHPITQVKKIALAIVFFFLPILFFSSPLLEFFPPRYKVALVLGWYLILTSFVLQSFLVWFFNVFIVTDERIIDVDFSNLIYKNISSAKIDNIEDITIETGGVMASVVDYGTIYIQTAGEKPEIEFEDVPQPAKVVSILNELMLEEEQEKLEGRAR